MSGQSRDRMFKLNNTAEWNGARRGRVKYKHPFKFRPLGADQRERIEHAYLNVGLDFFGALERDNAS